LCNGSVYNERDSIMQENHGEHGIPKAIEREVTGARKEEKNRTLGNEQSTTVTRVSNVKGVFPKHADKSGCSILEVATLRHLVDLFNEKMSQLIREISRVKSPKRQRNCCINS